MCERALIYARESEFEVKAGNRSPEEQVAVSLDWCGRTRCATCSQVGIEPVVVDGQPAIIDSGKGASRHSKTRDERSGWDRARDLLTNGDGKGRIHYLVTWSHTRATRDLGEYVELRKLCEGTGAKWCYSGRMWDLTDGDDRFRTGIDVLVAERDVEEMRKGVLRAVRANAQQGRPHGRKLYGYRRIYDSETKALTRIEEDPIQGPVVRRIFREYLKGKGLAAIARGLNDEGIRTMPVPRFPEGANWHSSGVGVLLRNAAYAGKRVFQGEVLGDALWPALVDERTFDRVQARLTSMRASRTRQVGKPKLLSGVARCGVCFDRCYGGGCSGRTVYRCSGAKACVARDLARVDELARARILAKIRQTQNLADRLKGTAKEPPEVSAARQQLAKLKKRLDDYREAFADGVEGTSAATLADLEARLTPKIAEAKRAVRKLQIPIKVDLPEDGNFERWWDDDLTDEVRREIVKAMIVSVEIHRTKPGRAPFDPKAIVFRWREQLD